MNETYYNHLPGTNDNIIDRFFFTLSRFFWLTTKAMEDQSLTTEESEEYEKYKALDYVQSLNFFPVNKSKGEELSDKEKENNAFYKLVKNSNAMSFHQTLKYYDTINDYLLSVAGELTEQEMFSRLMYVYVSNQVPFFHAVSPLNFTRKNVIMPNWSTPENFGDGVFDQLRYRIVSNNSMSGLIKELVGFTTTDAIENYCKEAKDIQEVKTTRWGSMYQNQQVTPLAWDSYIGYQELMATKVLNEIIFNME